jgi:hypothetical protein
LRENCLHKVFLVRPWGLSHWIPLRYRSQKKKDSTALRGLLGVPGVRDVMGDQLRWGPPLRRRPEIHDPGPGFGAPRSCGAKNGKEPAEPMWTGCGTAGTIPSTSDSWGTWVPDRTVHGWSGVKLRRRTLTFRTQNDSSVQDGPFLSWH